MITQVGRRADLEAQIKLSLTDNSSSSDTDPALGAVEVKGENVPVSLHEYRRPLTDARVVFDDQHRLVEADLTFAKAMTLHGGGGGIERYQYQLAADGRQIFTTTENGVSSEGIYNRLTPWESIKTYTVETDGNIRYPKDKPGSASASAPVPPSLPTPVDGPFLSKCHTAGTRGQVVRSTV